MFPVTEISVTAASWFSVVPVIIVLGVGVLGVLVESFVPDKHRRPIQLVLAAGGLIAAGVMTGVLWGRTDEGALTAFSGSVAVDRLTLVAQTLLLVLSLLALIVVASRSQGDDDVFTAQAGSVPGSQYEQEASRAGLYHAEIYPLFMFAVGGMMLFPAATDFVTLFVALEVFSLPLYVMAGLSRRRRLLSLEASFKYFVLGAFASALFIFGVALVYGATASVKFAEIFPTLLLVQSSPGMTPLAVVGVLLILSALLFKVGVVPFHNWTPDVYQGAPTPITGFMAATVKVAAVVALIRVTVAIVVPLEWDLRPMLAIVAAVTIVLGTAVSLVQADIKRMLAYSSVAHAGFLMIGIVALSDEAIGGIMIYLAAYGLATVGMFAAVSKVREKADDASGGQVLGEASSIIQWAGLAKKSPLVAASVSIFMLSFAGIPLTAGFLGKLGVFTSAVDHGYTWLVLVGVAASVAAAFVYVRLIVLMFFTEPTEDSRVVVDKSTATSAVILVSAVGTVIMGTIPSPVLDFLAEAAKFVL